MRALRWHKKYDIRVEDVPIPKVREDEVLIKVTYSGICGSEVHEYLAGPIFIPLEPHPLTNSKAPQIMGHEFGGQVVELGKNVKGISKDTLVTVNPMLTCGKCKPCLRGRPGLCTQLAYYGLIGDGGHAEYAVVKEENCIPLSPDIKGEYVAFGEPVAVAYHAVNQAQLKEDSTVVVIGGGPIGQLVGQYAKVLGANKVYLSEISSYRIEVAKEIGVFDEVFNPIDCNLVEEIFNRTDGFGADYVFECSGSNKSGLLEDTGAQSIELTHPEGTTIIVGIFASVSEVHFNKIVLMERKVIGSWTWHSKKEFNDAINMVIEGKIKVIPLISKRVKIEEAVLDGISALHYRKDQNLKILIDLT